MKNLLILTALLVFLGLGYGWRMHHESIEPEKPCSHQELIKSYVPIDYFPHKTRNQNLKPKFRG